MKTIQYITLGIWACLGLLIAACTERIEIFTEDAPERLVIYGYLTTDTTRHEVKITRSTGYFATIAPPAIRGAEVTISTETDVFVLTEDPGQPGVYLTGPDVYGVQGETYTLHVKADFYGDGQMEEYTATTFLPYAAETDSIWLKESEVFDDRIEVICFGRISEAPENYLSFRVFRNHEAMNDSIQDFSVIDDKYLDTKEIKGVNCYYLDQEEEKTLLQPGDLVTLRLDAITKEYYDFITNVLSELWGSNPLFGGPPANVQTNIRAVREGNNIPISGFFTAYSSSSASTVYR